MSLVSDLIFGLRVYRRRPVIAVTIVVTLALAIGAGGAIFSVIDAVLLHPVAVRNADRIVAITERSPSGADTQLPIGVYWKIARSSQAFDDFAAVFTTHLTLSGSDSPADITTALTTPDYFSVLGINPLLGRTFGKRDSSDGTWNQEAVISYSLWQSRFGAAPSVLGQHIELNGQLTSIVGVMPSNFTGTSLSGTTDVWVPVVMAPALGLPLLTDGDQLDQESPVYTVIGRMRQSTQLAAAAVDVSRAATTDSPASAGAQHVTIGSGVASQAFDLTPINEAVIVGGNRARVIQILVSVAALITTILILACLNIASILMAMGRQRATEFGVRIALGASTRRIYRQLMLEATLLAVPGAALGVWFRGVGLHLIANLSLPGRIELGRLSTTVSARSAAVMALATIAASIVFGLLPARQAAEWRASGILRGATSPRIGKRFGSLAVQVAISLMLLVGAALFLRSARIGLSTDLGFDPKPLAVLTAKSPFVGQHADVVRPYNDVAQSLERVQGIKVAFASHVPLEGTWMQRSFSGPLKAVRDPRVAPTMMGLETISSNYFQVLGVPIVSGRPFNTDDTERAARVIILNESAARELFPGKSPLGQTVTAGPIFDFTVVGVVRDTKYTSLQDTALAFAYQPMMQGDFRGRVQFIVRGDDPRRALAMLKQAAEAAPPNAFKSMRVDLETDRIASVLAPQRIGANLLSTLAIVALCIAAVGIYGTVSYAVTQRSAEIGVRRALGASASDIVAIVVRQCALDVSFGLIAGLLGSLMAGRLIAHFLFKIQPTDWVAFSDALVVMVCIAGAAAFIPALKAIRIDALNAMRSIS